MLLATAAYGALRHAGRRLAGAPVGPAALVPEHAGAGVRPCALSPLAVHRRNVRLLEVVIVDDDDDDLC